MKAERSRKQLLYNVKILSQMYLGHHSGCEYIEKDNGRVRCDKLTTQELDRRQDELIDIAISEITQAQERSMGR